MRIIAGQYKAKRLHSPKSEKTRPTLDRVKEAMFSILAPYLREANVLDLFSGTGNLAIESISRGAKFAWANDKENESVSTIISNVLLTNCKNYVKITKKDYRKALAQIEKENLTFDIIFLDPPYESKFALDTLQKISDSKDKILAKEGIIVYETDKIFINKIRKDNQKKEDVEDILDHFENILCVDERVYGNVVLKMYKWREL